MRGELRPLVLCLVAGCSRPSSDAPPAPGVPWQPHGLRVPDIHCTFTRLPGWTSGVPMPDHIAEWIRTPPSGQESMLASLIVEERVEADLPAAESQVLAYWRSGLVTAEGGRVVSNTSLGDAGAPARLMSVRWGKTHAGQVEAVALIAFPGLPVVDVVAHYAESDTVTAGQVDNFVRGLHCTR
jgi:hypothetical protein